MKKCIFIIILFWCFTLGMVLYANAQLVENIYPHQTSNPERKQHSYTTIHNYLLQLSDDLKGNLGNDDRQVAAAEFIAKKIVMPMINLPVSQRLRVQDETNDCDNPERSQQLKDLKVNYYAKLDAAYNDFVHSYWDVLIDYDQQVAAANLNPDGSLAHSDGTYSSLQDETETLYYKKMGDSPYLPYGSSGKQADARTNLSLLKTRNRNLIGVLQNYINKVDGIYWGLLNDGRRLEWETLVCFDRGAKFMFRMTQKVRRFEIVKAQQLYLRNQEKYDAWVEFYKAIQASSYGAGGSTAGFAIPNEVCPMASSGTFDYAEINFTNVQAADWNKFRAYINVHTYAWNPGSGFQLVEDYVMPTYHQYTDMFSFFAGSFDVSGCVTATRAKVAYQYPIVYPEQAAPAALVAKLAWATGVFYNKTNAVYGSFLNARKNLKDKLNSICYRYRTWFPYTKLYEVDDPHVFNRDFNNDNTGDDDGDWPVEGSPAYAPYFNGFTFNYWLQDWESLPEGTVTVKIRPISEQSVGSYFNFQADVQGGAPGTYYKYRWTITKIPQKHDIYDRIARSKNYVLYQVISTNYSVMAFKPDIAGDWEVTLEVNDERQLAVSLDNQALEFDVGVVPAKRLILGIKHNDYDFTLEKQGENGGAYNHYLEISNDNVDVYYNYDDDNCSIDSAQGTYVPPFDPETGMPEPIFKLRRYLHTQDFGSFGGIDMLRPLEALGLAGGIYDGTFGSTDLAINPSVKYKEISQLGPFQLRSSSWVNGWDIEAVPSFFLSPTLTYNPVTIIVEVTDPQINELTCEYQGPRLRQLFGVIIVEFPPFSGHPIVYEFSAKERFTRPAAPPGSPPIRELKGKYEIAQWMDKVSYENPDGTSEYEVVAKRNYTPDWMERTAAEAIVANIPVAAPVVADIRKGWGMLHDIPSVTVGDIFGYAPTWFAFSSFEIIIHPELKEVRLNSDFVDALGFYSPRANDSAACHLAFHQYYYHTVERRTRIYKDDDKDKLPDANEQYRFFYSYDSGIKTNYGGRTGPAFHYTYGLGPGAPEYRWGFDYQGDAMEDNTYRRTALLAIQDVVWHWPDNQSPPFLGSYEWDLNDYFPDYSIKKIKSLRVFVSWANSVDSRDDFEYEIMNSSIKSGLDYVKFSKTPKDQFTKNPKLVVELTEPAHVPGVMSPWELIALLARNREMHPFIYLDITVESVYSSKDMDASMAEPGSQYTGAWLTWFQ